MTWVATCSFLIKQRSRPALVGTLTTHSTLIHMITFIDKEISNNGIQCPLNSLNIIRLLQVVITPSVTTLLRGENDSKQSDEFQAIPWTARNKPFWWKILLDSMWVTVPSNRIFLWTFRHKRPSSLFILRPYTNVGLWNNTAW